MPIIELHSMSGVDALNCKTQIFNSAKKITPELLDRILVNICTDMCVDQKGDKQPFIRVFTINHEEQVLKILQNAGINVHIDIILEKRFIPKKN